MPDWKSPDWKGLVRSRLAALQLEGSSEEDLAEEISQHLEDRYRELRAGGESEAEAVRIAAAELDGICSMSAGRARAPKMPATNRAQLGDAREFNFWEDSLRDLRYAVRAMRNAPGFVLFVVLTLSIGIGANTTVFTVINTLLLNPLPVPHSSDLVAISAVKTGNRAPSGTPLPLSYADLKDIQDRNTSFRTFAAYTQPRGVSWQWKGSTQGLFTELVTGTYFSTLDLAPAKGRFFTPDEDRISGAHAVAVLNYGTWQSRFAGRTDIIGVKLRLNNVVFTVIGVAPPHFIGVNAVFGPDVWAPAAMAEQLFPQEMKSALTDRGKALFQGVGRLRAPTTPAQAQANLTVLAAGLAREYPETNEGRTALVRPLRDALLSNNGTGFMPVLFASTGLLIVVGIVLLIACSNVANLLLARAAGRQHEMAVRLALGANRRRLLRQLLTESVVLGLLSGLTGLFVAYAGLRLLFGTLPSAANFVAPRFDVVVFVFALLVSLATSLLFGTVPALKASRVGVAETLKQEVRTMGRGRDKVSFANALLVTQVAFSFLLLVMASLFLRSIGRAYAIDPGFQTAHLALFLTSPGQAGYGKPQTKQFYNDVRARIERIPGVQSVSWASNLPLWSRTESGLQVEGRQAKSHADKITTILDVVDRDFFATAGVSIESGRAFSGIDREDSAPVAIVNDELARRYWPGQTAIGKRVELPGEKQMRQIVGVARTANYTTWAEPPQACVYVPLTQRYSDAMILYVRTKISPDQVLAPIRQELQAIAPSVLVSFRTGQEVVAGGLFLPRVGVALLTVFGLLALGLASIGLYGILAYAVRQRQRELGLRIALGAAGPQLLALILKQGFSLVGAGVGIGLVAALLVGRLLGSMLYGVSPADPLSVGGAAAVLLAIALLACYLPARRATHVDPLTALREG